MFPLSRTRRSATSTSKEERGEIFLSRSISNSLLMTRPTAPELLQMYFVRSKWALTVESEVHSPASPPIVSSIPRLRFLTVRHLSGLKSTFRERESTKPRLCASSVPRESLEILSSYDLIVLYLSIPHNALLP